MPENSNLRIAFLGTGLMGAPMASNLARVGFDIGVWNRSVEKAQPLAGDGAVVFNSPNECVSQADVVITMLSDGNVVDQLMRSTGVANAMKEGSIHIDMSSTKPSEARELANYLNELGIHAIDAPVSGGTKAAIAGTLAIMAGGDEAVFKRALPVFMPMGRAVRVGSNGTGQLAKLANQAIVGVTIGAVAEAMLLIEKGGGDPAAVRQSLEGGFADSTILQQHGKRMSEHDFEPGGKSFIQLKDLNNGLEEAGNCDLKLPLVEHVQARYETLCGELGGGDKDHSALYLELLSINNLLDKAGRSE